MKVARYHPSMQSAWDAFVAASKNGTFLFQRGYMDYHADRFRDHSLVLSGEQGEVIGLLPANEADGALHSHAGLTYGGWVIDGGMTTPGMLQAFEATLAYLREHGIETLRYKTIPHIYHSHPAEEDRYALFCHGAHLYRRDVLAVLRPADRLPYQGRRVRKMKQAAKASITATRSEDYAAFWAILEENLARVHGAAPVHSVEEIRMLAARFSDSIHLHLASDAAGPVAGVVVYDTGRVAHVQYIASNDRGREAGALDLLFASLIEREYAARAWFDFGISNEDDGKVLNVGLIEQKEGFGARAVAHDFYELELA